MVGDFVKETVAREGDGGDDEEVMDEIEVESVNEAVDGVVEDADDEAADEADDRVVEPANPGLDDPLDRSMDDVNPTRGHP